jgi:hypothetical protein
MLSPAPANAMRKSRKRETDEQMRPGQSIGVLSGLQYWGRNVGMNVSVNAVHFHR